jgi:medium-chain acyl-[acyl-carrier-protein] hydrolase
MMSLRNFYDEAKCADVASATSSYLPKLPAADPQVKVRLFCFPFAGAGASVYRNWHHALPKSIEVCPVQLPGREERLLEVPFTRLAPLVDELGKVIEPYLDRPFAFFGHSMGALISFVLARHLRRMNQPLPVHLFISGRRAPQILGTESTTYHLPDLDFVEELRRLQGTPESVLQNSELMELFIPLLRADFELCETYNYHDEQPLDCPFSIFGGLDDADVSHNSLAGWETQTTYSLHLQMFPGDHFFMLDAQQKFLPLVSQQLQRIAHSRVTPEIF